MWSLIPLTKQNLLFSLGRIFLCTNWSSHYSPAGGSKLSAILNFAERKIFSRFTNSTWNISPSQQWLRQCPTLVFYLNFFFLCPTPLVLLGLRVRPAEGAADGVHWAAVGLFGFNEGDGGLQRSHGSTQVQAVRYAANDRTVIWGKRQNHGHHSS